MVRFLRSPSGGDDFDRLSYSDLRRVRKPTACSLGPTPQPLCYSTHCLLLYFRFRSHLFLPYIYLDRCFHSYLFILRLDSASALLTTSLPPSDATYIYSHVLFLREPPNYHPFSKTRAPSHKKPNSSLAAALVSSLPLRTQPQPYKRLVNLRNHQRLSQSCRR